MKTHEEYLEALDAFLDREMEPQKAAEMGLLAAQCAPFGAYVRDALAIRAAFPGIGDVSVPAGFAESVIAALPEQMSGAPETAPSPPEAEQVSKAEEKQETAPVPEARQEREAAPVPEAQQKQETAPVPEAQQERETARIPEAQQKQEADTQAIVEGVARLAAAAYAEERKVTNMADWDSGPNRADGPDNAGNSSFAGGPDNAGNPNFAGGPDAAGNPNSANGPGSADDWKAKWKKAALPLAACLGVILLAAGGFALSRGGTPPAVDNSDKNTVTAVASDGTEAPSISLGAGAAEFDRMGEEAQEEASLQSAEEAEAAQDAAPAEAEAAKEEAPPTPAPTEAPRQPSPTPSPSPSPTPSPSPVPTPTDVPPTPTPDTRADVPAQNANSPDTVDAGSENPWDNVELTLPDDAGYLFARYTPLEEEAGGALYAFSPEQYAALLDALDAAGFVSHTSVPSDSATIYVYLETDSAGEWEAGSETDGETDGEVETEPDFDPGEDGESGSSVDAEVEDFSRR